MQRQDVYKCELCGNIIEVTHVGGGPLVCCGQPMKAVAENTTDAAVEKHVPVVEQTEAGLRVTVGEVDHPMVEDHYIEWIEVITDKEVFRQYLAAGDPPQAVFDIKADSVKVRAYCNLHGLWKS